jgi:NADPH:quinone reductase-like Zn-dependent oxidoreductase
MKAIVQREYGSPDTLRLEDVDRPDAGLGHVLVRVRAASVNAADWHVMRGDPKLARLQLGLRRPKAPVRGRDFAGEVAKVGTGVSHVLPGDEVYGETGMTDGAFAEYVRAPAGQVAPKPDGLTFEEAAALPLAGCTALQALRDVARVQPGQRLLVNGASGGVGTFAVQIGKALGTHVTAVCSTRNLDLMRSLGADAVVDYTTEDALAAGERFDVVLVWWATVASVSCAGS